MNDDPRVKPHEVRLIEDPWTVARHIIEAVAIVAAGLWSFYVFIYEDRIKPAQAQASAVTAVRMESLGVRRGTEFVRVNLDFHNTGTTPIDIIADAVTVSGERLNAGARPRRDRTPSTSRDVDDVPLVKTDVVLRELVRREKAGGPKGQHYLLNPGEAGSDTELIAVAHGRYDALAAGAHFLYQRADAAAIRVDPELTQRGNLQFSADAHPLTIEDDVGTELVLAP